jgi:hypothetical protein
VEILIIKSFLGRFKSESRYNRKSLVAYWLPVNFVLAILLLSLISPSLTQAQVGPVDSFETDHLPILALAYAGTIPVGPISSSSSGAGILGGERDIEIEMTNGSTIGTQMRSWVASSVYVLECGSGVAGNTQVQWDGVDNSPNLNPMGLGGVDLTDGNINDSFGLVIISNDEDVTITITVYTDGGNYSTYNLFLPNNLSRRERTISFGDFTIGAGTGADFRNVGAITLTIPPTSDLDMRLDLLEIISTQPPPTPEEEHDDNTVPPPPPPPAPAGGGGPAPTATPAGPTMLPETGEFPPIYDWSLNGWTLIITGLVLAAVVVGGVWVKIKR